MELRWSSDAEGVTRPEVAELPDLGRAHRRLPVVGHPGLE